MTNALSKTQLFSLSIILITSIFISIQISSKQAEGQQQQQSTFIPDNKLKEQDDLLNSQTIVTNNIRNLTDFFQGNIYSIIALSLLAILLVLSVKIVFGRADIGKPYFDSRNRFEGYDGFSEVGAGGGFGGGDGGFDVGGCHGDSGGGGGCH
jgi:uncharacterized membrane protein YgcG